MQFAPRNDESLTKRLLTYSVAAGATLVAGVPSANAEVIYTAISDTINTHGDFLQYDLNGDGTMDVRFDLAIFTQVSSASMSMTVKGLNGAGQHGAALGTAVALDFGEEVGPPESHFGSAYLTMVGAFFVGSFSSIGGPFYGVGQKYLGILFPAGASDKHYGWVRVEASNVSPFSATLDVTGMAYEACASQPISAGAQSGGATCGQTVVPEPATLGTLALGVAGALALGLRRRRPEA